MILIAVVVLIGALVGLAAWWYATTTRQRDRDRDGVPGPVDVTDRAVSPPAPGSPAAERTDLPGSQRDRARHGKP